MKQAGQYLAAFFVLWALYEVVDYLGGGQFLKILPIGYTAMFILAVIRAVASAVLNFLYALKFYMDIRSGEDVKDPMPRWTAHHQCLVANLCLMAASALAETQTRPWAFCAYVVLAYVLLDIGNEAFKRSDEDRNESS